MEKQRVIYAILLIISTLAILYGLFFNMDSWIVYLIAIFAIPLFILSLGLLTMARPRKKDKEERVKEPCTGY